MFEKFTENAIKVIMLAQEESRRFQHNYVGTNDLLLGILGLGPIGSGELSTVLKNNGVTRETVLRLYSPTANPAYQKQVEIPFTDSVKRIWEKSWDVARNEHVTYIGVEHLFLALTFIPSDAQGTLGVLGVDDSTVNKIVEEARAISQGIKEIRGGDQPAKKTEPLITKDWDLALKMNSKTGAYDVVTKTDFSDWAVIGMLTHITDQIKKDMQGKRTISAA